MSAYTYERTVQLLQRATLYIHRLCQQISYIHLFEDTITAPYLIQISTWLQEIVFHCQNAIRNNTETNNLVYEKQVILLDVTSNLLDVLTQRVQGNI